MSFEEVESNIVEEDSKSNEEPQGLKPDRQEQAPDFETDEGRRIQEAIDFRINQSYGSRIAEYITGLRPDDPKIIERLANDHEIIRAKYGLPDIGMRFNDPTEYERLLRDIAKENEVDIRTRSECGKFFKENGIANGVYSSETNSVGIDIERETAVSYKDSLSVLEHEVIHSLQKARYPDMPIEACEYEAYTAGFNIDYIKKDPEAADTLDFVFSYMVGGSINNWYSRESKERGHDLERKWENPGFFLREIDGISEGEYKQSESFRRYEAEQQRLADEKSLEETRGELDQVFEGAGGENSEN